MTCEDCTRAKTTLWHGFSNCRGCDARAISRSLDAFYIKKLGPMDAFDNAIKAAGITHEAVRWWQEHDFINRGKA